MPVIFDAARYRQALLCVRPSVESLLFVRPSVESTEELSMESKGMPACMMSVAFFNNCPFLFFFQRGYGYD